MESYQQLANRDISASLSHHNVLDEFKDSSVEDRKSYCQEHALPYQVALLNITGELNMGTIVRNSVLMGASKIWIFGRRRWDRRGAVGSEHYIDIQYVDAMSDYEELDVDIIRQTFVDQDLTPVYVEHGGVTLNNFQWSNVFSDSTPVLVFGNENRGIPQSLLEGHIVSIPQRGVMRSFNVGVSSGIVMMNMLEKMGWA